MPNQQRKHRPRQQLREDPGDPHTHMHPHYTAVTAQQPTQTRTRMKVFYSHCWLTGHRMADSGDTTRATSRTCGPPAQQHHCHCTYRRSLTLSRALPSANRKCNTTAGRRPSSFSMSAWLRGGGGVGQQCARLSAATKKNTRHGILSPCGRESGEHASHPTAHCHKTSNIRRDCQSGGNTGTRTQLAAGAHNVHPQC